MKQLLLLLFLGINTYAQSTYLDSKIITVNNDTIKSKIQVSVNLFDKTLINEVSFYRTVKLVNDTYKKSEKIKAKDIKKIEFFDPKGEKRYYVNDNKQLKRLLYEGKLTWYRGLGYDSYNNIMQHHDYLIDKENNKYNLGLFNNKKKQLKEAVKSKPDLVKQIEDENQIDETVILKVLREFEK